MAILSFIRFFVSLLLVSSALALQWNSGNGVSWAFACNFAGNDLGSRRVAGSQCSNACAGFPRCTHFVWNQHQGGTCYFKGPRRVTRDDARPYTPPGAVCGLLGSSPRPRRGKLIFNENFNTLNTNVWQYEVRPPGWVNGEIQRYETNNAGIVGIAGGKALYVKLRKEGGDWQSSRLHTKGKFDFTYGRVDVRVKTSRVNGPFPAVWLLSSSDRPDYAWPRGGEIDIFEMQTAWDYIPASLHFQDRHAGNSVFYSNTDTYTNRWRVYSVDWTPSYIAFYHDNQEIGRYSKPTNANQNNWPYHGGNKFHLIINNAMHPDWGTAPAGSLTKHNLYIDYIRVWKF